MAINRNSIVKRVYARVVLVRKNQKRTILCRWGCVVGVVFMFQKRQVFFQ
jgi:hypothetical protein